MDVLALACLAATAALAVVAAYRDVVSFTLPNWLTLSVAAVFIPFAVVMYLSGTLSLATIGSALAVAAGIFAAGVVLFALGLFGGGDVKYLAAGTLWAWPVGLLQFLFITSLAGAVVAALYLILPRLASIGATSTLSPARASKLARPMPYGVAISIGLAYVLALWVVRIRA